MGNDFNFGLFGNSPANPPHVGDASYVYHSVQAHITRLKSVNGHECKLIEVNPEIEIQPVGFYICGNVDTKNKTMDDVWDNVNGVIVNYNTNANGDYQPNEAMIRFFAPQEGIFEQVYNTLTGNKTVPEAKKTFTASVANGQDISIVEVPAFDIAQR